MIESAAPRPRVKHSTTEALRSQAISVIGRLRGVRKVGIFIRLELPCYKLQITLPEKWHPVTHLFCEPCRVKTNELHSVHVLILDA